MFEEFMGGGIMEVLGAEIRKVIDDYIAVTWIPNRVKIQRHHRMEVRSMEENTLAAAEHGIPPTRNVKTVPNLIT
jgi:hypothetical protein